MVNHTQVQIKRPALLEGVGKVHVRLAEMANSEDELLKVRNRLRTRLDRLRLTEGGPCLTARAELGPPERQNGSDLGGGHSASERFRRWLSGFDRRQGRIVALRFSRSVGVHLGQEPVVVATRVRIAATDISLLIDSVERGETCRTGKIEGQKVIRRHEEQAMSYSRGISVSAYDPIRVVVAKQNRARRARRVDWKGQVSTSCRGDNRE